MPAVFMLMAEIPPDPGRLGDAGFMAIGPAIIFLAVLFWVGMTLWASRIRPRSQERFPGPPGRGPVQGGIIEGSPSQVNRRDPAPSVTEREARAWVEAAWAGERAVREKEAEARGARAERRAEPRPRRAGRRRRRFGPPRVR